MTEKFFPGIVNIYNPRQNIWNRIQKLSQIGQIKKLWNILVWILTTFTKTLILEERLQTSLGSQLIWKLYDLPCDL